MTKALTAFVIMGTLLLCACPGGGGSKEDASAGKTAGGDVVARTPPEEVPVKVDLASRGREIYFGTEYSNTGLSCAHCHAASPADEANGKLIAHTGYGAAARGSWKHTDQAQLDAKAGKAGSLLEAANFCVSAPYMNSKDHQISGQDGEALETYMASIADASAWDAAPFVIEVSRSMPAAGLTPDMENGKRIYENTCERCHDGIEGIEELHGLGEWMNPMQLMGKIRKMPDWFDTYESATYASLSSHNTDRVVAWMLGSTAAYAQEGNPCGENPRADNPCAQNPCGDNPCGAEHDDDEDSIFAEGAMPFFATDILSDQDVVDVAHYLIENE